MTTQMGTAAAWLAPAEVSRLQPGNPNWLRADDACPACIQQDLLERLLKQGDQALHEAIQLAWPLDTEAAFPAIPSPLRLHADPRFTGSGVTLALVDSDFYPHPDLTQPVNRIRAWVDASQAPTQVLFFRPDEQPHWPGWNDGAAPKAHGLMTSAVAAGNGWLSRGLYGGLASEAELVLVKVGSEAGIGNAALVRALAWLREQGPALGVRVVSLSVAGESAWPNPVDPLVARLVAEGISVVAAAGNDGQWHLAPPASSPDALTVGGLDDHNTFSHAELSQWHSNYGASTSGALKPELVAPSRWIVAPVLPNTATALEASVLFAHRAARTAGVEARLAELKLVTPHYQHVDGTSVAAPLVASTIACMLQANPALTPRLIRDVLANTAQRMPGVESERQGAGALAAGRAVAQALQEHHLVLQETLPNPQVSAAGITFTLHDHTAGSVALFGSWDGWRAPQEAAQLEPGVWRMVRPPLPPGSYAYKYRLDGARWLDDPANPRKVPDGYGDFNSFVTIGRSEGGGAGVEPPTGTLVT